MRISESSAKSSPKFKRWVSLGLVIGGLCLVLAVEVLNQQKASHDAKVKQQESIEAQKKAQEWKQKKANQRAQFLKEVEQYREGILALDPERRFIHDVYAPFSDLPVVYVQMSNDFVIQHKIYRLQLAQDLYKIWRDKTTEPATPFYLVDRNRNELTGMSWGKIVIKD